MNCRALRSGVVAVILGASASGALGDAGMLSLEPPAGGGQGTTSGAAAGEPERYGFLGLLDRRSVYGDYWFPEPLRADEGDVDNELRLDYFHSEKRGVVDNEARTEVEYSIGMLTLEVSGGYEWGRSEGENEEGFTNMEFAGRYPFLQWVSADGEIDDTFVIGLEVAPPVESQVSKDLEIVPKVFNLLRLGDHFSLQTGVGVSTLIGPEERGQSTMEYNATFGYELEKSVLPIPWTVRTIPMFELDGETKLNHGAGENALFGTVGARFEFETVGPFQPKLGVGYTIPLDQGARQEMDWGVLASIILEY